VIRRGDVVVADLSPVVGDEQGGRRPVVVLSPTTYNSWSIDMAVIAPITSVDRRLRHHVPIGKEAGLRNSSFVMPEYVRTVSQRRLEDRALGSATQQTLDKIEWWVSIFTTDSD
jgi:mRNA interferase MazF